MNDIKVGDVVAWADVPDGAMVRCEDGSYELRRGTTCRSFGFYRGPGVWSLSSSWRWLPTHAEERLTIIALGLTGQESANDLRRLAEVFEVREALRADDQLSLLMEADGVVRIDHIEDEQTQAERLHAAGWRPGMTAEDAARLLEQAGGAP